MAPYKSPLFWVCIFLLPLVQLQAQNLSLRASVGTSFILHNSQGNENSPREFELRTTSRFTPALVGTYLSKTGLGFHLGTARIPVKYKVERREAFLNIFTDPHVFKHLVSDDYASVFGGLSYGFPNKNIWQFHSHFSCIYANFPRREGDKNYFILKSTNGDTVHFVSKQIDIIENSRWGSHWGVVGGVEVSRHFLPHWSLSAEAKYTHFFGTFKTITIVYRDQLDYRPGVRGINVFTINPNLLSFLIGVKGDIDLRKKESVKAQ